MALTIIPKRVSRAITVAASYALGSIGKRSLKNMPMMWPSWRNGVPEWRMVDVKSYMEEGFGLNSLIYAACMYKAKAVASAPIRAYEGDQENPTRLAIHHPLTQLVSRPNEYQSQRQFMAMNEVFLNLTGNAFILLDRPAPGKMPTAMYPLNPDRIRIIPIGGNQVGYLFVPEGLSNEAGTPIIAEDMIHVKLPNPLDKLEGLGFGLSPIASMAKSADEDNRVTNYLYTLFKRGLMLGGVLQFKTPVADTVLDRTKQRWREMYGGAENWATEIGVLDNGASYQQIAPTFDQLGFGAIDERNEVRILSPFGVPPILIGSRIGLMRSTYANYQEARRACWEDTLMFEIDLFSDDFEYHLSPDDGTFVRADTSKVPALQKNIPELQKSAQGFWEMGVPARIAFKTVGLEVEEYEGMDTSYVPSHVIDATAEPTEPAPVPAIQAPPAASQPKLPSGAGDGAVTADAVEGGDASVDKSPKKGDSSAKKKDWKRAYRRLQKNR